MTSIQSLALPTKSVKIPFEGILDFVVEVNFITRSVTSEIMESSKVPKLNSVSGQIESTLDSDAFTARFASKAISGWEGLTHEGLCKLILIDETAIPDLSAPIEFSKENALYLLRNSNVFDTWINKQVFDLDRFRESETS